MFLVKFFVTCWRFRLLLVFLMLWLFIWFFLWNCTNKKNSNSISSNNSAATATKIQFNIIQFNLLTWKLNSAGPIKIPTTDIPQSPPSTTAKHVIKWSQSKFYRKLWLCWLVITCEGTDIFGTKFSFNWWSSTSCSTSLTNAALKHYMDDMQSYHVASLVHPLVLLEAEMFLTVQEDLKNQQMTILIHFNQLLNSDECPGLKRGWFGALVPLISLQFAVWLQNTVNSNWIKYWRNN